MKSTVRAIVTITFVALVRAIAALSSEQKNASLIPISL